MKQKQSSVIIECVALLIIGVFGLAGGVNSYLSMDARMQSSLLKPGIYVSGLSIAMIVAALAYAFLSLKQVQAMPKEKLGESQRKTRADTRVFFVLGTVGVYTCLISLIGYLLSTFLFLMAQFRLFGVASWWRNAAISGLVSMAFYLVFIRYGGMVFPHASLFE
jgi:hypothetical protein